MGRCADDDGGIFTKGVNLLEPVIYCVSCQLILCTLPCPLSHGACAELHPASGLPEVCLSLVAALTCATPALYPGFSLPYVLKETEFNIPSALDYSIIILKLTPSQHSDNAHCDDAPTVPS